MTRTKFIRLSGWSLILGGVSFSLTILGSFFPLDNILPTDFGLQMLVWVIPILLGVGLLGLRVRYGDEVGGFGKNILLLGAIAGPVINFTGAVIVAKVGNWSGPYTWLLPITGVAVLLACLSIFGIPALRAKPLPRWNSLPLIAGLWYPPLMILMYIDEALGIDQFSLSDLAGLVFLLQAVLLTVLGYMLQSKVPEEIPATA